jgi:hypothetical protein
MLGGLVVKHPPPTKHLPLTPAIPREVLIAFERYISMRRKIILIGIFALVLAACGATPTPSPTPLPTAVPPATGAGLGLWGISFEQEFPAGSFAPGTHRYQFYLQCPVINPDDLATEWVFFEVSEDATLLLEQVYLRINGLSTGKLTPINLEALHPEQTAIAVVTYVGIPESAAKLARDCEGLVRWDDKNPVLLTPGEPFRP